MIDSPVRIFNLQAQTEMKDAPLLSGRCDSAPICNFPYVGLGWSAAGNVLERTAI
jgi:hypothetical protein